METAGGARGDGGGGFGTRRYTKKSSDAEEPDIIEIRLAKPGAVQVAPFHPSPPESLMLSVHVDPASTAIGDTEAYGAPPRRVVPSEHDKTQPTSAGREPAVQATSDKIFVCASASETALRACSAAPTGRPALRAAWRAGSA